MHDALMVVKDVIENPNIVYGGGSPEAYVALKLRDWAKSLSGREQLAVEKFADALESTGDASAARAMRVAFEQFRLVLEPSGALALAAVLDGQIPKNENEVVVVVASGGNTDLATFARLQGCTGETSTN